MAQRSAAAVMDLLAERALQGGFGGLAISFAGWIDADGRGISAGPNIGWGAEALTDYAAAHGLRCHLENDLDARAWGEWQALSPEAQRQGDLMVINAGSGFALGMVIGGQLLRGHHRRAGEVGHLRGAARRHPEHGEVDIVEGILGGAFHRPGDLDDAAFTARWLDQAEQTLAPVIAALDPAHLIATGGILDNRPDLLGALNQRLIQCLPKAWWGTLELKASGAGEALARRGAVDLAERAAQTENR